MRLWALVAFALLFGAVAPSQAACQPSAEQEDSGAAEKQAPAPSGQQGAHAAQQPGEAAQRAENDRLDFERRATEAAEKQAVEAARANSWTPRNFQLSVLQALATVASVVFTGWAAIAAAQAARSAKMAVDVIPILERAYPFIVIEDETVARALGWFAKDSQLMSPIGPIPTVDFTVKNYGSTPARILDIVAHFRLVTPQPTADNGQSDFIPYESMLATGDKTEKFSVSFDKALTESDFFAIHNGTASIWLTGWISYRDIWGKAHSEMFGWRWNPILKKLVLANERPD